MPIHCIGTYNSIALTHWIRIIILSYLYLDIDLRHTVSILHRFWQIFLLMITKNGYMNNFIFDRWEVGNWSRCSQTCGGGRKTRLVVCKQHIDQNEEVILDDSECPGERPVSDRVCRRSNCPAVWVAEEWTEVTSYDCFLKFYYILHWALWKGGFKLGKKHPLMSGSTICISRPASKLMAV